MYLDAVERVSTNGMPEVLSNGTKCAIEIFDQWRDWEPSAVLHHGRLCCEIAREWLIDTDYSEMNGAGALTGPRWLSRRFQWGPCGYPIHWCEAVRRKVLDCGAHAALAQELFTVRGVKSYRAQLIQHYSIPAASHWEDKWLESGASVQWIKDDLIYHEGCAVLVAPGEVKLWDASAGWWIDPRSSTGYGSLTALRLVAPADSTELSWGPLRLTANEWRSIG